MTKMLSLNCMQAAVSSVNLGSLTAPNPSRNVRDFPRSATGRFTKIIRDIENPLFNDSIRLLFAPSSPKKQPRS